MNMNPKTRFDGSVTLKIIAIILFLFNLIAIIIIARNPCYGHEISVYHAVPPKVWMLLLVAIVGGIGIMVYQAMIDERRAGNFWWQIGLLLIVLSNLVIILLPYIRGYAFPDCGDHLSHVGYVKDIFQTGFTTSINVYPTTHIVISQLSYVMGISAVMITNLTGPMFYILFILFIFLLSREILSRPAMILAIAAGTILYCYFYIEVFPMGFAYLNSIVVFYLYFKHAKNKSVSLAILIFVSGVSIVFFHPVASFSLITALLIMELSKPFLEKLYTRKNKQDNDALYLDPKINFPLLFFAALMLWLWDHYGVWNSSVSSVTNWFYTELRTEPMTQIAVEVFDRFGLSFQDQVELFIKMYGHYFVYMILSLIAIEEIIRRCINSPSKDIKSISLLACFFLPSEAIWLIDYIMPLTTLSSGRLIWLVVPLFPPFVGLALHKISIMELEKLKNILTKDKLKLIQIASIAFIITTCSLIGIFSIYPSPFTLRTNPAVSYAMEEGHEWLLEFRIPDVKFISFGTASSWRFADALYGTKSRIKNNIFLMNEAERIGDHFNYTQYATLGESFKGDRYVISRSNFIEMIYTNLDYLFNKFSRDDFIILGSDPSVDFLYNNGDTQVWYVRGLREL